MHRSLFPYVDSIVSELLAEETRLKSHSEKGILSNPNPFVLAVPSKSSSNNQNRTSIGLPLMSAVFVSRKVIERLSVLS